LLRIEAAEDENVSQIVAGLFADAKVRLDEAAFVTGSGSGQPTGLVTAVSATAGSVVKAATDGAFALADPYAVQDDLPARYQDNVRWMCHKTIANKVRQFDNSASGQYALVDSLAGPVSRTILGDPLVLNSNFSTAIDTNDNYILAYGDFSQYVIVDRTGADSLNDDAFRLLNTTLANSAQSPPDS
jgi:HK97 family phage major capsid protein